MFFDRRIPETRRRLVPLGTTGGFSARFGRLGWSTNCCQNNRKCLRHAPWRQFILRRLPGQGAVDTGLTSCQVSNGIRSLRSSLAWDPARLRGGSLSRVWPKPRPIYGIRFWAPGWWNAARLLWMSMGDRPTTSLAPQMMRSFAPVPPCLHKFQILARCSSGCSASILRACLTNRPLT